MHPSKGKREKKRKRKEGRSAGQPSQDEPTIPEQRAPIPKTPEISEFVTIGFNSTSRCLEALARRYAPLDSGGQVQKGPKVPAMDLSNASATDVSNPKPMAAVFVPRSDQPSMLNSHLPLLIKAASLGSPDFPSPRLITLPKGADKRLSAAVSTPRVALIGLIDGAPEADALIDFIKQVVPEVDVPWLEETAKGGYQSVNIKAVQTSIPTQKEKNRLAPVIPELDKE